MILESSFSVKALFADAVCARPYSPPEHHLGTEPHNLVRPAAQCKANGDLRRFALFQRNTSETNLNLVFGYLSGVKNILTKVFSRLPELGGGELLTENVGTKQEAACNGHHCVHPLTAVRSVTGVSWAGANIQIPPSCRGHPCFLQKGSNFYPAPAAHPLAH